MSMIFIDSISSRLVVKASKSPLKETANSGFPEQNPVMKKYPR